MSNSNQTIQGCAHIQENIACNQELNDSQLLHLESCKFCQLFKTQMRKFDMKMFDNMDLSVPDRFSSKVMDKILEIHVKQQIHFLSKEKFISLIKNTCISMGIIISILQVLRYFISLFVFSLAAANV